MDPPNGDWQPSGRPHLPTPNDAFPYSPLTSIVPFDSGVIPLPSASPSRLPPISFGREDDERAKRTIARLDSESSLSGNPSLQLHQASRDVEQFLKSDDLTKYKFKSPRLPHRSTYMANGDASLSNSQMPPRKQKSKLGNFASALLQNMNDYPKYHAELPKQSNGNKNLPPKPHSKSAGHNVLSPTMSIEHTPHKHPVQANEPPIRAAPADSSSNIVLSPAVVIKGPTSSNPSEYQAHPEVDQVVLQEESKLSKKRKRGQEAPGASIPAVSVDQREKAEAALQDLTATFNTIFETEDNLEPDTSGAIPKDSQNVFVPVTQGEGLGYMLTRDIQNKVDGAVAKVVGGGRFSDVSSDDLSRFQKLCHNSVLASAGLDLAAPESSDEMAASAWGDRLEVSENSLRASRILLRIMTAGREERQLYSEEILQDLLQNFRHLLETCIIPITESRASSPYHQVLKSNKSLKAAVSDVLSRSGRVMRLLADFLNQVDVSESSINIIETTTATLIFVENATNDKEAILGSQKFEAFRRNAMDVLARIFLRFPAQRRSIVHEILTSLEKLPVTRQSARQFKVVDGKPIQLVSALLMQLIQTSASPSSSTQPSKKSRKEHGDQTAAESEDETSSTYTLMKTAKPLFDSAQSNATFVTNFLVQRALKSTKTGDQPYRNLLDIFTEDFLSVLGSPDWPAAELILRALLSHLIGIAESEKTPAPAKNMALDIMGVMGSGIADIRINIERSQRSLENAGDSLGSELCQIAETVLENQTNEEDLLSIQGPYRAVVDHFQIRDLHELQLQSARDLFLAQWARNIWTDAFADESVAHREAEPSENYEKVAEWLGLVMQDRLALDTDSGLGLVSVTYGRLAYAMAVMTMPFCKASRRIFAILVNALSSPHATVRSRSLKSVIQLLDKDPSILDRSSNIMGHILRSTSDPSTMVRDSALGLVGKCLFLRPSLESECFKTIIQRTADPAVSVRKRALRLGKDVYVQNERQEVRAAIADAFLTHVSDEEETVSEIARQSLEDIWLAPFYGKIDSTENHAQVQEALRKQASQIVATAQRGDVVVAALEPWFKQLLRESSKTTNANHRVCKELVKILFDRLIENEGLNGKTNRQHILQTLTVFAKSSPRLFNSDHMTTMRPYIENLSTVEDLLIYRSVVVIYRHVLPILPRLHHQFLHDVQSTLLSGIAKLGKMELNEVATCLWIINNVLQNSERLVKLLVSVLKGVQSSKDKDLSKDSENPTLNRVKRYMMIAGPFGKACNLDPNKDRFAEEFSWWKGDSISDLIVEIVGPFASSKQPLALREQALESILLICQSWPRNFFKKIVISSLESALKSADPRLEYAVLVGFRAFYVQEEEQSKSIAEGSTEQNGTTASERLGKSLISSDNDGAATSLAQQYLSHVLRIALASTSERALIAAEVVTSANRQGLVHPRECGPALVALETCPDKAIAKVAFEEHKNLNSKHESILEKEHLKAVEQAFAYQRDTIKDPSGVDSQLLPKLALFFEVLKAGSANSRKKIFGNLVKKLDFDPRQVTASSQMESHLLYAKFVCQNMALAEYGRIDEILHIINCVGAIFSTTGDVLAQKIESIIKVKEEAVANQEGREIHQHPVQEATSCKPEDLKRFTLSARVLMLLWQTRTHLRAAWGLQSLVRGGAAETNGDNKKGPGRRGRPPASDTNKAPTRSANVGTEEFLRGIETTTGPLSDEETMRTQCRTFMQLHSTDTEAKVAAGSDEDADVAEADRLDTPDGVTSFDREDRSATGGSAPPSGGNKRGRKRSSVGGASTAGTPTKTGKKRGRPPLGKRKSSGVNKMVLKEDGDDDGGWD
ncbi:MAG: Sister chromatid cohesion protein 2 [Alyxoria varia]|nr:MAG: Sister chromatid cohesion protein 2 [Alyxoria varia]